MSNKLLNESTIRRFMKLADIAPLANSFIKEGDMSYKADEEPMEEPMEEPPMPEEEPMDEPMEEPMEEPGAEGEMTLTDEEAQNIVDSHEANQALVDKLKGMTGEEEMEDPMEEPMEDPMADEPEDLGGEADLDLGGEEDELEELEIFDDEALMETVYKRVASRLIKEAKRG